MKTLNWREALPRMVADLIIVHASMAGALVASVIYRTALGYGASLSITQLSSGCFLPSSRWFFGSTVSTRTREATPAGTRCGSYSEVC